ncbi:MAG: MoxR family ATPase, partial [Nanoarchaeota archaeon]|nr:MoxR family ATPase [Nanoarchaeota archaeon]
IIVRKHGKNLVLFPDRLLNTMIDFIQCLRADPNVEKKPSVRATLGVFERAQANALLRNASQVSLKDVQDVLISVLSHRIRLKPSVKYMTKPEEYIEREFGKYCDREVPG